MNWIPNFLRRGILYDDLSEEMRLHIEERVEPGSCSLVWSMVRN